MKRENILYPVTNLNCPVRWSIHTANCVGGPKQNEQTKNPNNKSQVQLAHLTAREDGGFPSWSVVQVG